MGMAVGSTAHDGVWLASGGAAVLGGGGSGAGQGVIGYQMSGSAGSSDPMALLPGSGPPPSSGLPASVCRRDGAWMSHYTQGPDRVCVSHDCLFYACQVRFRRRGTRRGRRVMQIPKTLTRLTCASDTDPFTAGPPGSGTSR